MGAWLNLGECDQLIFRQTSEAQWPHQVCSASQVSSEILQ